MNAKLHSSITSSKDKLMEDLQRVVADAEALLHATSGQVGDAATSARARIQKSLQTAKASMVDAEDAMIESAKQAAAVTDQYVHDNPWTAIGLSACVGAVIGMLIARR
jgi:ElaB/YqjD/DUF883 family membrane-anchored ribosome-binding protein